MSKFSSSLEDTRLGPRQALRAFQPSKSFTPRVVLFDTRPQLIVDWAGALASRCDVQAAVDLSSLEQILASARYDVVVTGMAEGLAELVTKLPQRTRLIFCGSELPEPVVESVTRGYKIAYVDSADDLLKKIFSVTRAPRSVATRFQLDDLVMHLDTGASIKVLEISNHGLSFGLKHDERIEPYLPGATLGLIELRRGLTIAMSGARAVVRHIQPSTDPDLAYTIGCEFLPPDPEVPIGTFQSIEDRAQCASLMRSALRTDGIRLEAIHSHGYAIHCTGGAIDLARGEWSSSSAEESFNNLEIVRGQFETGGRVYSFVTTVVSGSPLKFRLPVVLEERNLRHSGRYNVRSSSPIMVELTSPLSSDSLLRPIRDLSSTGFSFDINLKYDLFPVGMHFSQVVITGGGQRFQCRGRIKNLTRFPGREKTLRCGVEFEALDEKTRVQLTDFVMRSRFPGVEDGRNVGFEEWLQFFRDTGFFTPEKAAALEPLLPEVRRMYESLTARPTKLFKSVVARDQGKVTGHMSGLLAYSKTWMFHHLAALPNQNVGHVVSLGSNECFNQSELEYFKAWFHSTVRWPNRVFGGIAKKVSNPELSQLTMYCHLQLPTSWTCEPPAGIQVIEARGSELVPVERFFVEQQNPLILKADDLTRDQLSLEAVNSKFAMLGLQRRRRILMAIEHDRPVGFALAEISSPGLNLSEGLSSFRIYLNKDGMRSSEQVRKALLLGLASVYQQAGRKIALGLLPADEASEYAKLGFNTQTQSFCWTAHRQLYTEVISHIEGIFEVLKRRSERKLIHKIPGPASPTSGEEP